MSVNTIGSIIGPSTGIPVVSGYLPGQLITVAAVANNNSTAASTTPSIASTFVKKLAISNLLVDATIQLIPNGELDATAVLLIDNVAVGNTIAFHGANGLNRYNLTLPFVVPKSSVSTGQHSIAIQMQVNGSNTIQIYTLYARISEYAVSAFQP